MKANEKKCSACAEIVKFEARVCKHCGHTFSDGELEAAARAKKAKADAQRQKRIDKEFKEELYADTIADLEGEEIAAEDIATIAADLKVPQSVVLARAAQLKMVIVEPLSDEQAAAVDASLRSNDYNDADTCQRVAEEFGVPWSRVYE